MIKSHAGVGSGIRFALVVTAISLAGSLQAMAGQNLFWSGNGTTQGGAGTWNTTTAHWDTAATGTPPGTYGTTWANANVDSAEFGGTSGAVNISGPLVVNLITTDLLGFNIGNGNAAGATNTITFSGAGAGVNTNYAGGTTTLSAIFNGTLTKSGAGRLELGNGSNPNTVKYVLNGGALTSASIARVSTNAPTALVQDFFTFNGGGWGINTGSQDTGATRGITIKSGGAFFGSSATTINLTISSPIVGTEGGGLTVTNVGPFVGNSHQSFNLLILNNTTATPNSWDGNLTIATGTVRLGAANQVPDTAVVNMVAGTFFDLATNTANETVKSISGAGGTVQVGGATLTINNPAGETYGGLFSSTASGVVIKNGSGAFTMNGSSVGFNGEFVMNNGTLGVGNSNLFGNAASTSKVTINGGVFSNTGTGGKTIPSPIPVAINADFAADDSLFNSSTPGQILFNGPITLKNGTRTITVNGTANLGLGGVVDDEGATRGIIKNGSGNLSLPNAANTYTGNTTINQGSISVDGDGSVGNGTGTLILNGGTFNASANHSTSSGAPTPNPVNVTASSSITCSAAAATPIFEFTGPVTGTAGQTLTFQDNSATATLFKPRFSGGNFTFDSNISLLTGTGALAATVQFESFNTTGTTQTYTGVISGPGSYNRSASAGGTGGTTIFSGPNTYSGGTLLGDGTIGFGVDSVGPANAPTSGPVGTGAITVNNINSPTLAAVGGARNVGNSIAFGAGNVMGISGSNDLTLAGDVSLGAVVRTITVTNSGQSVMSGAISGTTGAGLIKNGAGTLKITGNNTYDGSAPSVGTYGTAINVGTLLVSNTSGSGTGIGSVNVASGAVLGGTGTVGGAVVNDGTIAPGESVGTLSVTGNVTDDAGSSWAIELSGATADKLAVTGNIDLLATDSLVVTGTGSGTSWIIGTYTGTENGAFDTITSGYTVSYGGGNITLNAVGSCAPGDLNCDGHVDAQDYVFWRKTNGPAGNYTAWRANFGVPPGAGSGGGLKGGGAVPEPSAIGLLLIGLLTLGFRRRA